MSGFEIGGIVLGAFPMAIVAMDKYHVMLKHVKLWQTENYQSAVKSFALELRVQETLFRNSYQTLLLSFMDRATVIILFTDPLKPDSRQQTQITHIIRQKLGDRWSLYEAMMKRMKEALDHLFEELERCTTAAHVSSVAKVKAFFGRVRFSLNLNLRDGALAEIKTANQEFAALTMQLRTLHLLGRPRSKPESSAAVFMENRELILLFLGAISSDSSCSSGHLCQHEIEIGCLPKVEYKESDQVWLLGRTALIIQPSNTSKPFRVVTRPSFSIFQTPDAVLTGLCQLHIAPNHSEDYAGCERPKEPNEEQKELDCEPILTHRSETTNLPGSLDTNLRNPLVRYGWALDKTEGRYWLLNDPQIHDVPATVSLHKIIESNGRYSCFPRYFYEGDRSRLAANLAGAVLVFSAKGWLDSQWSTSDVLLKTRERDVDSESLKEPFMIFPLKSRPDPKRKLSNPPENSGEGTFGIRNQWLYSLGMALLELLLNRPLESFRATEEEANAQIAWRVESLALQHGGPRWAEIIFRCLHCPYSEQPDLSEIRFVQKIYEEVMEPLLAFNKLPSLCQYARQRKDGHSDSLTTLGERFRTERYDIPVHGLARPGNSTRAPYRTAE